MNPVDALKASILALDAQHIDVLYGLEPVYEPEAAGGPSTLGDYAEFLCPWCCENIGTIIDLTAGSRRLIEDCQVCCHPLEISVEVDSAGILRNVTVQRVE